MFRVHNVFVSVVLLIHCRLLQNTELQYGYVGYSLLLGWM